MSTLATLRQPAEITSNDVLEIRRWCKHTTDNIDWLNRARQYIPYIHYRKSANQSLAVSGTTYDITFDTAQTDTNPNSVISIRDNTRIYFTKAAMYTITVNLAFAANATGYRELHIEKNGSATKQWGNASAAAAGAGIAHSLTSTTTVFCDAGEYIVIRGTQTSGGALNVLGNAAIESSLQIIMSAALVV